MGVGGVISHRVLLLSVLTSGSCVGDWRGLSPAVAHHLEEGSAGGARRESWFAVHASERDVPSRR